jgi:hypothetical protein
LMNQGADQTGLRHESSANDEAEHNTKKGLEEVVAEQNRARGKKTEV